MTLPPLAQASGILEITLAAKTPMLQQYFQAKAAHSEALIAMRVGDFYEFYGDDAVTAAEALEITLTGREDGSNGRIPMAGVPFHSFEKYLARLVAAGFRVAICEQVEDPKKAKGLVRREVTRVLTAGTLVEDSMLRAGANNFLAAICVQDGKAGIATLDPSTGEFLVTEIEGDQIAERILQELARLQPVELLHTDDSAELGEIAKTGLGITTARQSASAPQLAEQMLLRHFDVANLQGFGCDGKASAIVAASMVLDYAGRNGLGLQHIDAITTYSLDGFMRMDPATRRSLELTQNISDGSRRATLLSVLDHTVTPMGARMLRRWVEQPLLSTEEIIRRQDAVARLIDQTIARGDLRDALKKVSDIERLVSRVASSLASPRDLVALRTSISSLPELDDALRKVSVGPLQALRNKLDLHEDLARHLEAALFDEVPHTIRDGGVFKEGFDTELDSLRRLRREGTDYIAKLEQSEREATGIDKLKVGFNSVFGYYLEASKTQLDKVPPHYIRKQTTANTERYITAELKEHEAAVLGNEEKAVAVETDLFSILINRVAAHSQSLLQTARTIAELDVLVNFAEVALQNRYCRPEITEDDILQIEGGRHPVVECFGNSFVPNDTMLGSPTRLVVLTGPNMSGKSTYLRQTALIVLLAQIGCWVPAKSAKIGLCDRIFTRIGAKDEIALGQSTFMVEMVESANILNHATDRSLVILDEVGRGTSTYDGLAIAWAMVEYLAGLGSKTLFATHYHQMNAIAEQISTVANFRVSVDEVGDQVVWTHRVLPGGTDRSYGIQVARMAGVPPAVLHRASEILGDLEDRPGGPSVGPGLQNVQMTLFEAERPAILNELDKLDVTRLSPIEALLKLDEWKRTLT